MANVVQMRQQPGWWRRTFAMDSFKNFLAGLGVVDRDKAANQQFYLDVLSIEQLEAAYRGDWLSRKVVDIPAFDACREWRQWKADQKQIEKIEEAERKFGLQRKVMDAIAKSRLYGGAAVIMGIKGQKFEDELKPESVDKDQLAFVHVVARWQLQTGQIVRDITSPWFGEPEYYERTNMPVSPSVGGVTLKGGDFPKAPGMLTIHPSRVIRLIGLDYPDIERAPDSWGDSALQPVVDAIKNAGLVGGSIAALTGKASVDIIRIPGLAANLATTEGTSKLVERFANANAAKSVVNALLLDKDEEWTQLNATFSGLPQVLQMYLLIASGAADIPATRLLGRSAEGMNATGDSDIRNYYDRIASDQAVRMTPLLSRLDEVLIRSIFGDRDPEIHYEWSPLWQMDDDQKAAVALKKAQAHKIDVDSGLIAPDALRKGRENQLIEDGTYPGLETAIKEAEDEAAAEVPEEAFSPHPILIQKEKQRQENAERFAQQMKMGGGPRGNGGGGLFGKPKPKPKPKLNGGGNGAARDSVQDDDEPPLVFDWNPDQPRVPAGSPDGGQWLGAGNARESSARIEHDKPDMPYAKQIDAEVAAHAKKMGWEVAHLSNFDRAQQKFKASARLGLGVSPAAWSLSSDEEKALVNTYGSIDNAWNVMSGYEASLKSESTPATTQHTSPFKKKAMGEHKDFKPSKSLEEHKARVSKVLSETALRNTRYRWQMKKFIEEATILHNYDETMIKGLKLKIAESFARQGVMAAHKGDPKHVAADLIAQATSIAFHAGENPEWVNQFTSGVAKATTVSLPPKKPEAGKGFTTLAEVEADNKLKSAVAINQPLDIFLNTLSLAENSALKEKYGTIAAAMDFMKIQIKGEKDAAAQAAAQAAKQVAKSPVSPSDLEKAKKTTPYYPVPESSEGKALAAKWNEKYSGKQINPTDIKALEQKVSDYKVTAAQIKAIEEKQAGVLAEQAKAAAAKAAAEQAAKAAEQAKKEAEAQAAQEAELKDIMSQLGLNATDANVFQAFIDLSGSKYNKQSMIEQFKKYQAEGSHKGYPISPFEFAMLESYTGSGHAAVNKELRNPSWSDRTLVFAKTVNNALKKLPTYTKETRRGTSLTAEQQLKYATVGHNVEELAFMSTSKTHPWSGNTQWYVKGTSGRDIQSLSHHHGEAEVLYPCRTFFKIDKVEGKPGGQMTVWMHEVEAF